MLGVLPEQEQAQRPPLAPGSPALAFCWWGAAFLLKGETSDLYFIFVTRGLLCFSFLPFSSLEWF